LIIVRDRNENATYLDRETADEVQRAASEANYEDQIHERAPVSILLEKFQSYFI
jgi:hypothetical protein